MINTRRVIDIIYAGFCRFVGCALFGGLVSLIILFIALFFGLYGIFGGYWKHIFWVIPTAWGILGIFWFDKMLDIARDIFETPFNG